MIKIEIFKLFGSIFVDNEKANKSIARTDSNAKKLTVSFGKAVKTAAKWTAGAAALGTGLFAMANKTAQTTDRIDKLSQRLGLSREGFQEWEFVLSQAGVSIDSMQMGMKTLSQRMNESMEGSGKGAEAFRQLGISITQNMSQEEAFNKTITALQNMDDGIQKASLAQEIFGRNGQELLPLLNSQAGSVDELKQKAQELGLVISDDAVNAGVKFTDTLDQVKRSGGALVTKIGAAVMPGIQQLLDWVLSNMPIIQSKVQGVFSVINFLIIGFTKTIAFAKDNANLLIPVLAGLTATITALTVIGTVTKLIDIWKASTFAQTIAQNGLNAALKANPIGIVVTLIGVLIAVGVSLWRNWDTVKVKMLAIWDIIKISASNVSQKISRAWFTLSVKIQEIVLKIVKAAEPLTKFLPEKVANSFKGAGEKIEASLEETKKRIDESSENLEENKKRMNQALEDLKNSFHDSTGEIKEDTQIMNEEVTEDTTSVSKGFSNIGSTASTAARKVGKAVVNITEKIDLMVGIIDQRFELWKLKNNAVEESSVALQMQLNSQLEKQGLINEKIVQMEGHLENLKLKYGESSQEALEYTQRLLEAKIAQEKLASEIRETTIKLDEQNNKMSKSMMYKNSKGTYTYYDSKTNTSRIGNKDGSITVINDKGIKKHDAPTEKEIREIARRRKVDLGVAKSMAWANKLNKDKKKVPQYAKGTKNAKKGLALVGEKGPELVRFNGGERVYNAKNTEKMLSGRSIIQNITINSPTPLNPSEVARQNKNAMRKLALEW